MADFGDVADEASPTVHPNVNGGSDPDDSEILDRIEVDNISQGGVRAVAQEMLDREHEQETVDVLRTMSELDTGDGIYWRISRISHEDPSMNGHMATWPDARVTLDNIKDNFGGGVYRCKGFRSSGGYAGHKTVRIAGDAIRKKVSVEAAPTTNTGFDVQGFLAQMEARDERRRREDRELQDRRDAQREKYILTLGPAVLTALGGLFNRPQLDVGALAAAMRPPAPPDPLQMIAALKQLAPEAPKPTTDPMATAIQLFELLADKAGAGQGRADWLDIVKEGVKVLGPSVGGAIEATIQQAHANAQNPQASGVHPQGSSNGAASPAALPAPSVSPQLQHQAQEAGMLDLLPYLPWLKGQLSKLANAASRNRDPELYAAMFLEELPSGLTPKRVLELLSRPDWLDQLARFEPAIVDATVPWWQRLQQLILVMIRESQAPAPAPAPKGAPVAVTRPQGLPSLTGESS